MSKSEPEPSANRKPIGFGPFWLDQRIAVGGSAEVFLARPKQGALPAARLVVKRLVSTARQSADFDVLQIAHAFEGATGFWRQRPEVAVSGASA